jgi:rRNA maturation endonuclease Nob1
VLYANVDRPRTRFFVPLEHRHYCPGCKSTITVTGWGFGAKEEVKHTCDACGDDSVFCCATRREAPATDGMTPQK